MKLLYVIQRYGEGVPGGAEQHCRDFATRVAARGHDVHVVTSCARDYADWSNEFAPGTSQIQGVQVHRLPVALPRDQRRFADLDARLAQPAFTPRWLQEEWMRMQGPWVPEMGPWLDAHASDYDLVIPVTYLYFPTWLAVSRLQGRVPLLMHPTAHDESYLYLRLFDRVFAGASGFAFLTPEEDALVRRRFRTRAPGAVVGMGSVTTTKAPDAGLFRARYGLADRPYLLFLGRFDVGKAADELLAYFLALKERNPGPLALVVVGHAVVDVPDHPDIVVTGFVDEAQKAGAIAGATALVQPSYFESFSIVLLEAWAHGVPALVQGRCEVLAGQVRRAGAGIAYEGFAEFEATVEMMMTDPALRSGLGERGRRHVTAGFDWADVMDAYESLLERVAA